MSQAEPAGGQVPARPVIGLALLAGCAVAGWFSLVGLAAAGYPLGPEGAPRHAWKEYAYLFVLGVVAASTIHRSGLRVLAREGCRSKPGSWAGGWLCWFAHFKVTLVSLAAALALSWWGWRALMMWLVAPTIWAWGPNPPAGLQIHFDLRGPQYLLVIVSVSWVAVVPFLVSDVWRLLRPLMDARAARLRLPFALVSLLVAVGAVLLIRQHSLGLFNFAFSSVPLEDLTIAAPGAALPKEQ